MPEAADRPSQGSERTRRERGALVGILTRSDLDPHCGHLEWTLVRAAMTPDPVIVAPDCSIATVAGLLLGIIRRSDLLRVLRDDARSTPKGASGAS